MRSIIILIFSICFNFHALAKTLDDIRVEATNIIRALEHGEIDENTTRVLLDRLEQEALQVHQKNNALVNESSSRTSIQQNTPPIQQEQRNYAQQNIEPQTQTVLKSIQDPKIENVSPPNHEKHSPGGLSFLRRFISFSWLLDIFMFFGYILLVVAGVAVFLFVATLVRQALGQAERHIQSRNPVIIRSPPTSNFRSTQNSASRHHQNQQNTAIAAPHSGEVPPNLC